MAPEQPGSGGGWSRALFVLVGVTLGPYIGYLVGFHIILDGKVVSGIILIPVVGATAIVGLIFGLVLARILGKRFDR